MPQLSRSGRAGAVASWVALALLGLVVAAAVSLAASRLSSQHIGISSEPITAGRQLAPSTTTQPKVPPARNKADSRRKPAPASSVPAAPVSRAPSPAPALVPAAPPVQPTPAPRTTAPAPKRTAGDDSRDGSPSHHPSGRDD